MNTQPRILAQEVSYTYEEAETPALQKVSAAIAPGEFVAVLGHNGSGKSTFAKLLNALYIPTEGRLLVCGLDTREEDKVWDVRQHAGMIFQNPDNQLVATVVREPVAIAGVLAMEPEILVADEATAMLDPFGRRDVLETVRRLNKEKGITVVWITHYMEEAVQADRILVVSDGQIVKEGTPREIFRQVDALRKLHLDVPPMTALSAQLREAGMPLPDGVLTVEEMAEEVAKLLCPLK